MGTVAFKSFAIVAWLLTGLCSLAQGCQSGDCQPGVIAGPYSAPQVAENTASNFPRCQSLSCRTGLWTGDQIEGIDAQQNIGTSYQFYDVRLNLDTNIAVGPTATGEECASASVGEWSIRPGF